LTTTRLFPLLDRLSAYDVDFYLASHDPEPLSRTRLVDDAALLKTIGETVATMGLDRGAILDQLLQRLQTPLTADHGEIVDAFLAGLQMPVVASIW
jgi:hypothetical protein